jgi:tryptophan halogenase
MRIGRCARTWRHNVVAIGLAAGFVEPLESTGIELAQLGSEFLSDSLRERGSNASISQRIYNAKMEQVYDEIADYIQLHYILTSREDTPYWYDQKYSDAALRHETLVKLTRREAGFSNDESGDVFSNTSWNAILIGMRKLPLRENLPRVDAGKYREACKWMDDNFRASKRQSVEISDGRRNPTHFEFLSETVYQGAERPDVA